MRQGARRLHEVAAKIETNLDAAPGEMVYPLQETGELHAAHQIDVLVTVSGQPLDVLRYLVTTATNG